ncbi:MAG: sulfatase-like hydrolase/transferase [Gammaproteobacteria bacterium]|nr:sulfatase-like hydrolase/transferase [Gammaproteobacteria bacterium]
MNTPSTTAGAATPPARHHVTDRYWPVLVLSSLYMALGAMLRLALWWKFGQAADIGPGRLPQILASGVAADLVECLYLFAPLTIYIFAVPDRWYRTKWNRRLLAAGTAVTIFIALYLSVMEYYFFEEFDARFNLVAVDYLMYPTEVIGDIRDEYPVATMFALAVAVTAALLWLGRAHLRAGYSRPARFRERLPPAAAHLLLLGAAIAWFPTDMLAFSRNRVINEIAANGPSSFFRALHTNEIDYHAYYRTSDSSAAFRTLTGFLGSRGEGEFTRLAEGRLDRRIAPRAEGLGKLNVVVVVGESFGAEFSRLHGSAQDLTPEFDAIARQGIWFSNTYASGTRTVRGLEAITASFPPIPSVSILRRPNNEHIASWGQIMDEAGYQSSFLYGGYGYFDNMTYFYEHNGFEVLDRNQIDKIRFENIWGVSDEDLFDRALEHFDERHAAGKPFFSMIMTTSNHKPFTFRAGVPGVPERGGGRSAGVRYADFALGEFIRDARQHPWFDDTVFVIVADHGARVYGKQEIPLKTYEIPFAIYSPKHLAPSRVDTLTTQIDIAPTVLGLLGFGYTAPFFGRDVLGHPDSDAVALFSHNHDVAIYRDGQLVVFGLGKGTKSFSYDRGKDRYTPVKADPALADLGVAYYQVAYELFRKHLYE